MKRCSFQVHTVKRKETSFKMELGSLKGELSHAHITTSYRPQTGPQAGHCLQPVRRSRCAPQFPPFFCKGKPLPCSLVLVSLTAVLCYSYMNWLCCFLKGLNDHHMAIGKIICMLRGVRSGCLYLQEPFYLEYIFPMEMDKVLLQK